MIPVKQRILIVIGVLALAGIIIFFTFFNNKRSRIDYKDLIDAKDETIKVLQQQRPIFEKHIEELKSVIEDHQKTDSILVTKISTNRQTIKQVDDKIKNIPGRIDAFAHNNDSIRAAFAN